MMLSMPKHSECQVFEEVDPTCRYGRFSEILLRGKWKTVYRAFDEYQGIEVSWNIVNLNDFVRTGEDLQNLYGAIHLLKTLQHKNVMKVYSLWVDASEKRINFISEMFTSGSLRQYMGRHKRVDVRAVKHWCRQILGGLVHLHGQHPPIFHLNLNCDNIFINGNNGEVKIGELGLAAMRWKQELTAPKFLAKAEMYSFGVCVLEIINLGYPYEECSNPAQICDTHITGRKPAAKLFAEKCLAAVCRGLSARELQNQPFLQTEEPGSVSGEDDFTSGISSSTLCSDGSFISSMASSDYLSDSEISLKGTMGDDGSISVRLKLTHKDGQMKCIRFPFDVHKDTAAGVATEIVAELNVGDQEAARIAEMIDVEIRLLVPQRKIGRFPKWGRKTSAECRPKMRERFKEFYEKEACVGSLKKPNACLDELDFKELSILSEILNSKLKVKNNSVIKRN